MRVLKRLGVYVLLIAAVYFGVSLAYYAWNMPRQAASTDEVIGKVRRYEENASRFNLLFLGDSRTYCDISPKRIDALLGTSSYNLAHWSNWMVSQYALYQDLAPRIPKGTTVVWSLGRASFRDGEIAAKYPFTARQALHFLRAGIPLSRLWETLTAFNPLLRFSNKRLNVLTSIRNLLARPIWTPPAEAIASTPGTPGTDWTSRYSAPDVDRVEVLREDGRVTSVALHQHDGHYERVEIDHDFFVSKRQARQFSDAEARAFTVPEPSPAYWQLFLESLDTFQAAGVHLILNVLEEAPHSYGHPLVRKKWREFFLNRVAPEAEQRGIPFVYVDFSGFSDDDYFDYNHMNRQGAEAYAPLLARALKPLLHE